MKRSVSEMEETLKQILAKLEKLDKIELDVAVVKNDVKQMDRSMKEEFGKVNRKLDSITEAVMKTMEDITELKDKVEKQEVAIRVIRGGAANG